jgi:serine/threonine-protein kinase
MTVTHQAQFPGYEILGELGRSNARVLKARHLQTGDLVAIKHFYQDTDQETLSRFQQELKMMLAIQHPNIVQVREVNLETSFPFVAMELIEGGLLRRLFKTGGKLDVATVIRLGLQMSLALKEISAHSIIHRDIKPENILYRHLPSGVRWVGLAGHL